MARERKFYRAVIQVEVLSEQPFDGKAPNLDALHEAISSGDDSGAVKLVSEEVVDGKRMAELLKAQGSDPSFFQLDADGNNLE